MESSITHARARLEIHKLCNLGFLEKKGQGRNTYYIRTSKVVSLGERLRPQGKRIPPQHGTLGEKIPPQHGTLGERYQGENERYQGEVGTFGERYQGVNREELLLLLPDDIKKRIDEVGKRTFLYCYIEIQSHSKIRILRFCWKTISSSIGFRR